MSEPVTVEGGKYTFQASDLEPWIVVEREGEPWLTLSEGSEAVAALLGELVDARRKLAATEHRLLERDLRLAKLDQAVVRQGRSAGDWERKTQRLQRSAGIARTLMDLAGAQQVSPALRRQMAISSDELRVLGAAEELPHEALDPGNLFAVTAHEGQVVSLYLQRALSPEEAVRLAAWLIVGADLAGYSSPLGRAIATVEAIEAT